MYLVDIDGVLTLHNKIEGEVSLSRLKHFKDVYNNLCLLLIERGMPHLDTWIYPTDETGIRFAEFFGFVATGRDIIVRVDGIDHQLQELRCEFPALEEIA